ncbi:MAG: 16S rRNA (guanine1516-N2)-methyltransferase [Kiritimatiellia bacterium]
MQVTTSTRPTVHTLRRARYLADIPGLDWVDRRVMDASRPALMVGRTGLALLCGERQFRWHPGLLHTRIEAGWSHPMVRAMRLAPGDRVLDCSLGLGTDAMFMTRLTGQPVVALEMIPALALLTREGLRGYGVQDIHVICTESAHFMASLPDNCFDVVQGDPMFPKGTGVTPSLEGVRQIAHASPLSLEWVQQAVRVARKTVVVRDIDRGSLLEMLGAPEIFRVRKGRPRYGVWRSGPDV